MWRGPGRGRCVGRGLGNSVGSFGSADTIRRCRSYLLFSLVRHRLSRSWWPGRIGAGSSWMGEVKTGLTLTLKPRVVVLEDLLCCVPGWFLSPCSCIVCASFSGLRLFSRLLGIQWGRIAAPNGANWRGSWGESKGGIVTWRKYPYLGGLGEILGVVKGRSGRAGVQSGTNP